MSLQSPYIRARARGRAQAIPAQATDGSVWRGVSGRICRLSGMRLPGRQHMCMPHERRGLLLCAHRLHENLFCDAFAIAPYPAHKTVPGAPPYASGLRTQKISAPVRRRSVQESTQHQRVRSHRKLHRKGASMNYATIHTLRRGTSLGSSWLLSICGLLIGPDDG